MILPGFLPSPRGSCTAVSDHLREENHLECTIVPTRACSSGFYIIDSSLDSYVLGVGMVCRTPHIRAPHRQEGGKYGCMIPRPAFPLQSSSPQDKKWGHVKIQTASYESARLSMSLHPKGRHPIQLHQESTRLFNEMMYRAAIDPTHQLHAATTLIVEPFIGSTKEQNKSFTRLIFETAKPRHRNQRPFGRFEL